MNIRKALQFKNDFDTCFNYTIKALGWATAYAIPLVLFLGLPNFIRDADVSVMASTLISVSDDVEDLKTSKDMISRELNQLQNKMKVQYAKR